jgi:two-component system, chemotaxis family, response regulator Rcp1
VRIPVLIMTSSDSEKDRAEAQRLEADRYFRKPSSYDEFLKLGLLIKEMLPGPIH